MVSIEPILNKVQLFKNLNIYTCKRLDCQTHHPALVNIILEFLNGCISFNIIKYNYDDSEVAHPQSGSSST